MFEILFKHLAVGGRIVIVGAITGYKTIGFPDISIQNLPIKVKELNFFSIIIIIATKYTAH